MRLNRQRLARSNPLPEGAILIAAGIAIAGLAQYGFLAIAARTLGPDAFAPFATFWSMLFILGPGFFFPLEQEVGRALAARRTHGDGGRPVVVRALIAGGSIAFVLIAISLLLHRQIADSFYQGQTIFVFALALGLAVYACAHTARGTLSGNGSFTRYGILVGAEGIFRIVGCIVAALLLTHIAGAYAFSLGFATLAAIGVSFIRAHGLLKPGKHASWGELSNALGFLLLASVGMNFLFSAGPVVMPLLEKASEHASAGKFLSARVIAYIPLYFFQAIANSLLPKLAALLAAKKIEEYRRSLLRLLIGTGVFGGVASLLAFVFGPLAVNILFHYSDLRGTDLGLLTLSCTGFMLASVLSQSLVSVRSYWGAAAGWGFAVLTFVAVVAAGQDLFLRIELGLFASSVAPVVLMSILLWIRLARGELKVEPAAISQAEFEPTEI